MKKSDKEKKLEEKQLREVEKINVSTAPIEKLWELKPVLAHIPAGKFKEQLEARTRLKKVRYMLFRLRNQLEKKEPLDKVDGLLPGFIDFWLGEKPVYAMDPRGQKINVPPNKNKHVFELGGYATFAQVWDVNEDLEVYLRHSSVWQEWNATLYRVAPVLGEY